MKFIKILSIALLAFMLSGCGPKLGTGETPEDYKERLKQKNKKLTSTAFVVAAAKNDIQSVEWYMKANLFEVDATDNNGNTALILAVNKGLPDMVKKLLELGADPSLKSNKNMSPLEDACALNKLSVVKVIIPAIKEKDPDLLGTESAVRWAARQGFLDIVKYLVEEGASIEGKSAEGWTPMMWATKSGHIEVVEYLIEKGADLNVGDKDKYTAYDWSRCGSGGSYPKISSLLRKKGAKGTLNSRCE